MKTEPSCTISNALHILKLTEIARKSHIQDSEHLRERNKQENTKHMTTQDYLYYLHGCYSCLNGEDRSPLSSIPTMYKLQIHRPSSRTSHTLLMLQNIFISENEYVFILKTRTWSGVFSRPCSLPEEQKVRYATPNIKEIFQKGEKQPIEEFDKPFANHYPLLR